MVVGAGAPIQFLFVANPPVVGVQDAQSLGNLQLKGLDSSTSKHICQTKDLFICVIDICIGFIWIAWKFELVVQV